MIVKDNLIVYKFIFINRNKSVQFLNFNKSLHLKKASENVEKLEFKYLHHISNVISMLYFIYY